MRKLKRKILSLFLAAALSVTLAALLAPPKVFADTPDYTYSPVRQKYAIAPAAVYTNLDFYKEYVKTDAVWAFNSITYFTENALNYSTEKVDYTQTFTKMVL